MPLVKYRRKDLIEVLTKFVEYIETTDFPIIAEFAHLNNIPEETLKSFQNRKEQVKITRESIQYDFSHAYKKALAKQQTYLVKLSVKRGQNAAPMFLLKALHGYREQDQQTPQETHVHIHQQSAEKVKKLGDDDLAALLQQEMLKPADKRKRKSPRN